MTLQFKAKNQEPNDDDVMRGKYAPVDKTLKHRPFTGRKLLKLASMVGLLLGAGSLMALHHFFYARLNEKRIDLGSTELSPLLQSQRNVNIAGTIVAHGARIMLSTAIGATFEQMLWETLRSRSHSLVQIDALVRCGRSPFHPSAFRAATASLALFIVSVAASATALVVVLSPASLTINSSFERRIPCSVPTVPQEVMSPSHQLVYRAAFQAVALTSLPKTILALNTYLPTQRNSTTACDDTTSTSTCSYNVTFVAPAMDCVDITNETDFTAFLGPHVDSLNPDDIFLTQPALSSTIWDASFQSFGIVVLSRDLEKDLLQANNCSVFNATYEVGVSLQKSSATVQIWSMTLGTALDLYSTCFSCTYALNAIEGLQGVCYAIVNSPNTDCLDSPFFATASSGNSTFTDTVAHFVESYMQNYSISLLSGNIFYDYSNDSKTNLDTIETTCSSNVAVYTYNPVRLLSVYGVAMAFTTIIICYGCLLVKRNDVEQSCLLSDIIRISLNEGIMALLNEDAKCGISDETRIQLFRADDSRHQSLKYVTLEIIGTSTTPVSLSAWSALSAQMKHFTTARSRMLLLLFSALLCVILNHAYYCYLDGREPGISLHLAFYSGWALNQTVASDVGSGLAYMGQTMLAVAIVTSYSQRFWRAMRHRMHVVFEADALIEAQANPLNTSIFSTLQASVDLFLVALLGASMSLISIFAPGSIKINSMHKQLEDCIASVPRNLSTLVTNTTYSQLGDNRGAVFTVMLSGTYQPPLNVCGSSYHTSHCTYDLELVGPGFYCEDVTMSSNYTAFANLAGSDNIMVWDTISTDQPSDGAGKLCIQTWDVNRSIYQAINCSAVLRRYSIVISHSESTSLINVTNSRIFSESTINIYQPVTFVDSYFQDIFAFLNTSRLSFDPKRDLGWFLKSGEELPTLAPLGIGTLGIGAIQLNGTISWNPDMSLAFEELIQNATLSILSGQVSSLNPDVPDILQNVTTTCTYTYTAYEYSPSRLFLTYGIGISVTILCVLWGCVAISRNGVDETMDFSRFLRAVSNERMYNARDTLDKDAVIKADDTAEGSLAPADL